jgi:hypothetical protein
MNGGDHLGSIGKINARIVLRRGPFTSRAAIDVTETPITSSVDFSSRFFRSTP